MVREQLIINGVDVPLQGSLNPNITYSIQDIEEPDKRKAAYSKTIKLPASKKLNELFNFIFEINIDGEFNANKKADAIYLVDSQIQLSGFIKLNSITYLDNSDISYDCTLLGEFANLMIDVGELELDDIKDLNDFDHPYNYTEASLSWDTSHNFQLVHRPFNFGSGYIYPLIDYGEQTALDDFKITDTYPAFFVKELWDRIFKDAGYTYTSNFLNTDKRFKRAIVPFNGDKFGLSGSQLENRKFTADGGFAGNPFFDESVFASSVLKFSDVLDPGSIHSNGIFTAPATGRYNVSVSLQLDAIFKPIATEIVKSNNKLRVSVQMLLDSNPVPIDSTSFFISPDYNTDIPIGGTYDTNPTPPFPSDEYNKNVTTPIAACGVPTTIINRTTINPPNLVNLNLIDYPIFIGSKIKIQVTVQDIKVNNGCGGRYYNTTSGNTFDGLFDLNITNATFKANQLNTQYADNDFIDMYSAIPRKVKQRDFLMSIINMFNLYAEPNKENPKNIRLEPREDFYSSATKDWSEKLDVSNPLIFEPMGALDSGRYLFTYKEDKDYYNEKYLGDYEDIYGEREVIVDNDFLKNVNTNKIIFSPTPLVGQSYNDRVISTIIKVDQNQQSQSTKSNIRYLIYDGLKPTATTWKLDNNLLNQYPYAGHFDDPFNPTVDVNFGLPYEIYYDDTFNIINVTDNNLYNSLHKKRIDEITDKDSKVVKGRFYLTPQDIAKLSFRDQYWFNNAYHRLLKINNYNPSAVNLTECWFLKLKVKEQYTPITELLGGGKGKFINDNTKGDQEPTPVFKQIQKADGNSYNPKSQTISGSDNYVNKSATEVEILGDNNNVQAEAQDIYIKGHNNTVLGGLENVTLINTNDTVVTESNVTYIAGQLMPGSPGAIVTTDEDVVIVDPSKIGYQLEPTIDAKVDMPDPVGLDGKCMWFKKTSLDNNIRIDFRPTSLIEDGNGITIKRHNTTLVLYSDGAMWKVK